MNLLCHLLQFSAHFPSLLQAPPPPGTPYTMDSSGLGARRRLGRDMANTTQQGR